MKETRIRIKYLLQISDHDGYCSGNECDYEEFVYKKEIAILPEDFEDDENKIFKDLTYYEKFLEHPQLNNCCSYYCEASKEASDHNLDIHDYRITILSIKMI